MRLLEIFQLAFHVDINLMEIEKISIKIRSSFTRYKFEGLPVRVSDKFE